jgi:hypothetical protein
MNEIEKKQIIEVEKLEVERGNAKRSKEFKVPKKADSELLLPIKYADMFDSMVKDLQKKNPENDPLLEMQIKRIAEQRIFYLIMLNYETSADFIPGDKSFKEIPAGEISFRSIYARIKYYLGTDYDPQKHSKQIDEMVKQFMNRTESGKREFGRVKAFVDTTIRIINQYLGKLKIDQAIILKMKTEIGELVDKTVR